MERVKGNLIDLAEQGEFDLIVHGCNCFHAMGGGIAREISHRYPEAEAADDATEMGSREKLGDFSFATVNNQGHSFIIVNAYTQYRWSGTQDVFEYEAFEAFLNRLHTFMYSLSNQLPGAVRVGFPKIGCGLAKGDESRIMESLLSFSNRVHPWGRVTLVTL